MHPHHDPVKYPSSHYLMTHEIHKSLFLDAANTFPSIFMSALPEFSPKHRVPVSEGLFFPKSRCWKKQVIRYLGRQSNSVNTWGQYVFLSVTADLAPFLVHGLLLISHSHCELAAACVSHCWGRLLPVSCQLTLPTSCCLPPAAAPVSVQPKRIS